MEITKDECREEAKMYHTIIRQLMDKSTPYAQLIVGLALITEIAQTCPEDMRPSLKAVIDKAVEHMWERNVNGG